VKVQVLPVVFVTTHPATEHTGGGFTMVRFDGNVSVTVTVPGPLPRFETVTVYGMVEPG
jgi:hypothetical protein